MDQVLVAGGGLMLDACYRGRRVLVTGDTGFKGSWLVAWLNRLGAEVLGYSLGSVSTPSHWQLLKPACQTIFADIRDLDAISEAVRSFEPEIVFHLAAQSLVLASYADPSQTFATNTLGTVNVLEAVRRYHAKCAVVIVTTDKCYENLGQEAAYKEDDALGGHDPYSASKAAAEMVTASYRRSFFEPALYGDRHQTLVASARAGNVIGGGDWADNRLIPDLIRAVVNDAPLRVRMPHATRPWQHVLDPLAGYLMLGQRLLAGEKQFAGSYNFGPDDVHGLSVRQIIERFTRHFPQLKTHYLDDQVGPHEAGKLALDSSKARQQLAWQPRWDSDEAVHRTAHWYAAYLTAGTLNTEQDLDAYTQAMVETGAATR